MVFINFDRIEVCLIVVKTKKNTRNLILNLLKKEVTLTVNDLTDRLNITHMAVRKHLISLEEEGVIKSVSVKQPMGRPLQKYSLTQQGELLFPKNYEGLSVEFLKDIKDMHGEESIQLLFSKREQRLTEEYKPKTQQKSMAEKIHEIARIQNEKGYMASVTKIADDSYELVEYNCPIFAVANEFKVACRCETEMFKNILETDQVRRVCCKTDGDDHCKFIFQDKKED
ncbi:transcriptional regulator [Bacillus selenatarsenatis]|uniref:Transcriptional regulator n=1 Tax=Mesobacillus selenatarsenatis TaxID=388741 RepID=A0A846TI95_9BACI|nr:metalloregulator ArsR/SmtB family transcription factor [Mesobacillus selenatarsenatis]NKE06670.1 transcriptional regulator [Mesobacillus selenatarsenatis]